MCIPSRRRIRGNMIVVMGHKRTTEVFLAPLASTVSPLPVPVFENQSEQIPVF